MPTRLHFRRLTPESEATIIAKNRPAASDRVVMSDELSDRLDALWNGPGAVQKPTTIPADLVISNIIPLPNAEIMERDLLIQIIMAPNVQDRTGACGAVFISQPKHPERWGGREIYATLFIEYEKNALSVGDVAVPDGIELTEKQGEYIEQCTMRAVGDWYGIQLALLHPQIKDVFQNPKLTPVRKAKPGRKKKQRVARYVKTHYIRSKDIDAAIHRAGTIERKTLCWYVIGHWRHYKNGSKRFIKGYWKGPLREAKQNFDDGRLRLIETEGDNSCN